MPVIFIYLRSIIIKLWTETAHIFTPKDDSLEARIDAYKCIHEAWLNAEASLKLGDDDEWRDTLGNKEEIQQALKISINSLQVAAEAFTKEEITQARKTHLIEDHEAQELIQNQRQNEMRGLHDKQQSSDSSEHSQKPYSGRLRGIEGENAKYPPHGFQGLAFGKIENESFLLPHLRCVKIG